MTSTGTTAIGSGQIAWSDGAYPVIDAIDRATFVDTGQRAVFASFENEDSANTRSPEG